MRCVKYEWFGMENYFHQCRRMIVWIWGVRHVMYMVLRYCEFDDEERNKKRKQDCVCPKQILMYIEFLPNL